MRGELKNLPAPLVQISLQKAADQYLAGFHGERNRQGLGNALISDLLIFCLSCEAKRRELKMTTGCFKINSIVLEEFRGFYGRRS